jgi:hypothetical protein
MSSFYLNDDSPLKIHKNGVPFFNIGSHNRHTYTNNINLYKNKYLELRKMFLLNKTQTERNVINNVRYNALTGNLRSLKRSMDKYSIQEFKDISKIVSNGQSTSGTCGCGELIMPGETCINQYFIIYDTQMYVTYMSWYNSSLDTPAPPMPNYYYFAFSFALYVPNMLDPYSVDETIVEYMNNYYNINQMIYSTVKTSSTLPSGGYCMNSYCDGGSISATNCFAWSESMLTASSGSFTSYDIVNCSSSWPQTTSYCNNVAPSISSIIYTPSNEPNTAPYLYVFTMTNNSGCSNKFDTTITFVDSYGDSYNFVLCACCYISSGIYYDVLEPGSNAITTTYTYNGDTYNVINPGTYTVTIPSILISQTIEFSAVSTSGSTQIQTVTILS